MLDLNRIRVVAFDCVHTVFDVSAMTQQEMRDYVAQVRRPEWEELNIPECWMECGPHRDAVEGINRIGQKYVTATCSNWPAWLLADRSTCFGGINWSAIIPMESVRAYKPRPIAYLNVANVCGVEPERVLMVTANETAPDIAAARLLCMQAILVDREDKYGGEYPRTLVELADLLGC